MNRSHFKLAAGAIAVFLILAAPAAQAQRKQLYPSDKYVSATQAADALVNEKERVFLIDVRNGWEYNDFHIPGANNIAVQVIRDPKNLAKIPKGRKIILYCRTGVRSERALGILLANGYDAYSMEGGMASWWKNILEPPSITMHPFGKQGEKFRKRQELRDYFTKLPAKPAYAR